MEVYQCQQEEYSHTGHGERWVWMIQRDTCYLTVIMLPLIPSTQDSGQGKDFIHGQVQNLQIPCTTYKIM